MGNRRREAFGVRRLAGAFDGNLPTPTTSTPLSLESWAIEGAKPLEFARLPAPSTVIFPPPPPPPLRPLQSWAIESAKRLECAGLPALSTVISLPPQPQPLCR